MKHCNRFQGLRASGAVGAGGANLCRSLVLQKRGRTKPRATLTARERCGNHSCYRAMLGCLKSASSFSKDPLGLSTSLLATPVHAGPVPCISPGYPENLARRSMEFASTPKHYRGCRKVQIHLK